jgi:hypothetical protein
LLLLWLCLSLPLPVRIASTGEWLALDATRYLHAGYGNGIPTAMGQLLPAQPPLWPWLLSLWQSVAGGLYPNAIDAARGLSALITGGCLLLTYLVALYQFQYRWLACLSTLLLLTMGPVVGVLGTATPYALGMLWILLLTWWLQQAPSAKGLTTGRQQAQTSKRIGTSRFSSKRHQQEPWLSFWLPVGVIAMALHLTLGCLGSLSVALLLGRQWPRQWRGWLALGLPTVLVALTWVLWVSQHPQGVVSPFMTGVQALLLGQMVSFTWSGLACNLLLVLVPWGVFFLPQPDGSSAASKRQALPVQLTRYIPKLLLVGILSCGAYPVTAFALVAPFLAMRLTHYFGIDANRATCLPHLRSRVDWSMSLLMVFALAATGWIFSYLPSEGLWPHWHLPGQPLLKTLTLLGHEVEMNDPFPIWKLWLMGIPIVMVLVATIACLLSWWERFERSVFWMAGGIMGLVLLVRFLALPILWPAYEGAVAKQVIQLQTHMRVPTWQITENRLNPVSYYLPLVPPIVLPSPVIDDKKDHNNTIEAAETNGTDALETDAQGKLTRPPHHVVGLSSERHFYEQGYLQAGFNGKLYKRLPDVIHVPRLMLYIATE